MASALKQNRRIAIDLEEDEDVRSAAEIVKDAVLSLRAAALQSLVYAKLSKIEARRRLGSYCLALFSVMLVVFLAALMLTVLGNVQILFLRLAEENDGEIDLRITPGGQVSEANSLNYTHIKKLFPDPGAQSFHSARIEVGSGSAFLVKWSNCNVSVVADLWTPPLAGDGSLCTTRQGCVRERCTSPTRPYVATDLYAIDTVREKRMGLGEKWPYTIGPNDIIIDDVIAAQLQAEVGEQVILFGDFSYPLMQAFVNAGLDDDAEAFLFSERPVYTTYGNVIIPKTVVAISPKSYGKLGSSSSSFAFVDFASFVPDAVASGLSPDVSPGNRSLVSSTSSDTCASAVYFNFPPADRIDTYTRSDYRTVRRLALAFVSRIVAAIGFNQISVSTPILTFLEGNRFFSIFLGLIISIIITALAFLSIVLIYSLLSVNIQTKTFELGVMRMVGFPKINLTGLVIVNAMFFAIPAWVLGLVLAQVAYLLLRVQLSALIEVDLPPVLGGNAIGFATLAGLGIPLVASIAPCFTVLAQSLPEALDTERGRIMAVQYKISAVNDGYLNFTIILLGICFTVFGFLLYSLFPTALLNFDFQLLFFIFFAILLGMLAGLVLLSLNFERVMETVVSYLFLFWESSIVFTLIQKNLAAHRIQNRKTTLMYALSLGFIIFITVAFSIQLLSIEYNAMKQIGSTLSVKSTMQIHHLQEIDSFISTNLTDKVSAYTWITNPLSSQIANCTIMTVGRFYTESTRAKAISPNFFDVVDNQFLSVRENLGSGFSLGESLYSADGSGRLVLSTTSYRNMALGSLNDPFMFVATTGEAGNQVQTRYVVASSAVLDAAPVLRASQFPNAQGLDVAMSLPALVMHSGGGLVSIRDVNVDSIILSAAEPNVGFVQNMLTAKLASMGLTNTSARNIYRTREQLSTANTIVTVFFTFTQVMAMTICFFALISSMSTNVFQQSKEIGILRCIGMHRFPLYRIFIWEAFVLVTSASFLGLVIGTVVAYTMLLQNILFTQNPLPFIFPYVQLITILVVSLVTAFLASVSPVAYLLNLPSITHILRRTV